MVATQSNRVEVVLNGITYTTNELTGNQDTAIAELLLSPEMDSLVNLLLSTLSNTAGVDIAGDPKFMVAALQGFRGRGLQKLVSILLVPKDNPVYRKSENEQLEEVIGDLPNSKLKEILTDFFILNLSSVLNFRVSSSEEPMRTTETQVETVNP